eukprot:scaffold12020_cov122-Isochrysis_galbana.AAC.7
MSRRQNDWVGGGVFWPAPLGRSRQASNLEKTSSSSGVGARNSGLDSAASAPATNRCAGRSAESAAPRHAPDDTDGDGAAAPSCASTPSHSASAALSSSALTPDRSPSVAICSPANKSPRRAARRREADHGASTPAGASAAPPTADSSAPQAACRLKPASELQNEGPLRPAARSPPNSPPAEPPARLPAAPTAASTAAATRGSCTAA